VATEQTVTVSAADLVRLLYLSRLDGTVPARLWAACRTQAPAVVEEMETLVRQSEGEPLHWRCLMGDA
jgi:hypothetical protein